MDLMTEGEQIVGAQVSAASANWALADRWSNRAERSPAFEPTVHTCTDLVGVPQC